MAFLYSMQNIDKICLFYIKLLQLLAEHNNTIVLFKHKVLQTIFSNLFNNETRLFATSTSNISYKIIEQELNGNFEISVLRFDFYKRTL